MSSSRIAPVRRIFTLPDDPVSAGAARRLLRTIAEEVGGAGWLDAAELACTEVITNVVLHAHTPIELTVECDANGVLVEVRDFNPVLPVQRQYDEAATTGRGLALVAAMTSDHGIRDVGPDGKTVWFRVDASVTGPREEELLAAWGDADWDIGELLIDATPRETRVRVQLLGLPSTLWLAARQHHDALLRELRLYLAEHEDVVVDITATDAARGAVSTAVVRLIEQARAAGEARRPLPDGHPSPLPHVPPSLNVTIEVAPEAGRGFRAMQDTLDAGERLAEEGRLLAHPGLPEIIAVRDWACEQVSSQLSSVAPSPWPGTDQERFTAAVHDRAGESYSPGWDAAVVRNARHGVVAADSANRIVAISRPLANTLLWPVEELVGRRVVALIPPRLREGHVAGFTRHLTTGEALVLNVPLTLPVLRRDGTEILCSFLV